jgi:hypothetical protein
LAEAAFEIVKMLRGTVGVHFNVAVVEVLRPAGDAEGVRGVLCERAEADALHAARDHKAAGGIRPHAR